MRHRSPILTIQQRHLQAALALALLLLSTRVSGQHQFIDLENYGWYQTYVFRSDHSDPARRCGTNCGKSVAMDGDLLVLGAEETADSSAIVMERRGTRWEKVANLFRGGSLMEQTFAEAVAVENGVIAVLTVDHTVSGEPGKVYLYFEPPGGWPGPSGWVFHSIELEGMQTADGKFAGLAIENGVVFAGVPGASWVKTTTRHGGVQIWEPPYPDWNSYQSELDGSPQVLAPDHAFIVSEIPIGSRETGSHVRLNRTANGQELVVAGSQCLWKWTRSGLTWKRAPLGIYCLPSGRDLSSFDYDGTHFAVGSTDPDISIGDLAFVGEAVDQPGGWQAAATFRVFEYGEHAGERFGHSVSLNGNELLVGAPDTGVFNSDDGTIFRFLEGPTGWEDMDVDVFDSYAKPDLFENGFLVHIRHWSTAMARSGERLAVTHMVGYQSGGVAIHEPSYPVFADGFESGDTTAWGPTRYQNRGNSTIQRDLVTANGNRLYLSKEGFCAETAARHATWADHPPASACTGQLDDRLPEGGNVPTPVTLGSIEFETSDSFFLGTPWTDGLPGPDIAISGPENLTVRTAAGTPDIYSFGFLIFEPNALDTSTVGSEDDSLFTVRLYRDSTLVDTFEFNPSDNQATFIGVWTDQPFDRAVLSEGLFYPLSGSLGANEYFGPFYSGTTPRP